MSENILDETRVARAQAAFAAVPFAKLLGLEMGELKPGEATLHLAVRDELKQNQGVMHGGAVASLIDTASAFAVVHATGTSRARHDHRSYDSLFASNCFGPSDRNRASHTRRTTPVRAFD